MSFSYSADPLGFISTIWQLSSVILKNITKGIGCLHIAAMPTYMLESKHVQVWANIWSKGHFLLKVCVDYFAQQQISWLKVVFLLSFHCGHLGEWAVCWGRRHSVLWWNRPAHSGSSCTDVRLLGLHAYKDRIYSLICGTLRPYSSVISQRNWPDHHEDSINGGGGAGPSCLKLLLQPSPHEVSFKFCFCKHVASHSVKKVNPQK